MCFWTRCVRRQRRERSNHRSNAAAMPVDHRMHTASCGLLAAPPPLACSSGRRPERRIAVAGLEEVTSQSVIPIQNIGSLEFGKCGFELNKKVAETISPTAARNTAEVET